MLGIRIPCVSPLPSCIVWPVYPLHHGTALYYVHMLLVAAADATFETVRPGFLGHDLATLHEHSYAKPSLQCVRVQVIAACAFKGAV
jgi:hypothetical protein